MVQALIEIVCLLFLNRKVSTFRDNYNSQLTIGMHTICNKYYLPNVLILEVRNSKALLYIHMCICNNSKLMLEGPSL